MPRSTRRSTTTRSRRASASSASSRRPTRARASRPTSARKRRSGRRSSRPPTSSSIEAGPAAFAMRVETADVVVVGAGPVGLTLAVDLAGRGVKVIVAETRAEAEPPSVKCNHIAARSMEQYRRLGIAAKVRNAGLPPDYPNDVVFRTTVTGIELGRIHIPSRATRYSDTTGPDGWWPTPEPPHRINQIYLEPTLFAHAEARRGITIRTRHEAIGFAQDANGVTVDARDLASGAASRVRARFLIGCDGGRSLVRKAIGAAFAGTPVIQRVQSTY